MDIHTTESRVKEVDELLADLKAATNTKTCTALYNRVTFTLTHDYWFTKEQRASIAAGAQTSLGLTKNQKKLNLPTFREEEERYTDEAYWYEGCEPLVPIGLKLCSLLMHHDHSELTD